MKNRSEPGHAGKLRQKAEAILRDQASQPPPEDQVDLSTEDLHELHAHRIKLEMENMELSAALSTDDVRRTLHELRVHQIELELQNEELRTAHDEMEAVKARYYDLYNLAPVGYVTLSEPGLILEANLAAAALLGTDRDALITQPLVRFIHKADQNAYHLYHRQVFKTGTPLERELRLVQADDGYAWAHLAASSAREDNGKQACRMVISDISKRKQAEEQLQRVLAEKDKLFAIIAHDLRSPLFGFVGIARLLAGNGIEWPPDKLQNVFLSMKESAETLFYLLENLLEWSSLQRGEFKHEPVDLDWEYLVKDNMVLARTMADQKGVALQRIVPRGLKVFADQHMLNTVLRNPAQEKGLEFICYSEVDLPDILQGDPSHLRQILANLVGNAVKFTKQGEVVVKVQRVERNAGMLECGDAGIEEDERNAGMLECGDAGIGEVHGSTVQRLMMRLLVVWV